MKTQEGALSDVVHELMDATPENDSAKVSVGGLIDALDERGYGATLAVLPLIELTPIGSIPGVPTLISLVLAVLAVRLLLNYEHIWAPDWIRRRELKAARVKKSLDWLQPVAERIDSRLHERLKRFAGQTGQRAACVVILCLLVTVPPLEFVPFASSGPMVVISVFGLGILFRDGLLMLCGFAGAALLAGLGLVVLAGS